MITILSLVYNHEKYLDVFFAGILSQKVDQEWEVIIGIDKSSDRSKEICVSYQEKYPENIKLVIHEERVGMLKNFLSVYALCTGEFIAFCEGDDYWTDECKLQMQVDSLKQNKEAVISFTDLMVYDEEQNIFHKNWAKIEKNQWTITDIIKANCITTCTVMMRNIIPLQTIETFTGLEMLDWPLYIMALNKGDAIFLEKKTAVYRRANSGTYSKNPILQQALKKEKVYEYLLKHSSLKKFKKIIKLSSFINRYSIAVILPKSDPDRRKYFKQVMIGALFHGGYSFSIKSVVRFFFN